MNEFKKLKKDNKKKWLNEFKKTNFGKVQIQRYKRLLIYSILLFICSILLLLDGIFFSKDAFTYVASFILFVFASVFLIGRYSIMDKNLNDYLKNKKK